MAVRLFIRDKENGSVHEYGSNQHDSLYIVDGELRYVNMQNLCSSPKTYEFVHDPEQGKVPYDEMLFDIGGDKRGMCSGCKNRDMAACGACVRNPYRSDNYEPDGRIAAYEKRLLMHTLFEDRPESGFNEDFI